MSYNIIQLSLYWSIILQQISARDPNMFSYFSARTYFLGGGVPPTPPQAPLTFFLEPPNTPYNFFVTPKHPLQFFGEPLLSLNPLLAPNGGINRFCGDVVGMLWATTVLFRKSRPRRQCSAHGRLRLRKGSF